MDVVMVQVVTVLVEAMCCAIGLVGAVMRAAVGLVGAVMRAAVSRGSDDGGGADSRGGGLMVKVEVVTEEVWRTSCWRWSYW